MLEPFCMSKLLLKVDGLLLAKRNEQKITLSVKRDSIRFQLGFSPAGKWGGNFENAKTKPFNYQFLFCWILGCLPKVIMHYSSPAILQA